VKRWFPAVPTGFNPGHCASVSYHGCSAVVTRAAGIITSILEQYQEIFQFILYIKRPIGNKEDTIILKSEEGKYQENPLWK
jgi:hypothetical protein